MKQSFNTNETDLRFNSETFNEDYNKLIQEYLLKNKQTAKPEADNQGQGQGRLITPTPVCVFKTFDDKEEKIFINILSHKDVAAPKEENILEMNNQYGIRVPMSISEKNEDFDNAGKICSVYDAIFNDKVADQAIKDPELMRFVLTLILERIQQRFNHKLDFNKLKPMRNLKYKGKAVRSQMIKIVDRKVEEVIKKNDNLLISTNEQGSVQEIIQEQTPVWDLFVSKEDWGCIEHIKFLTSLESGKGNEKDLYYEGKRRVNSFSCFDIDNIQMCSVADGIKVFPYDSYNIQASFNWKSLIFQVDTPLLSKSFAVKVSTHEHNIVHLKVPKLYNLTLNLYWMSKVFIDNVVFDPNGRKIYIFIQNQNLTRNDSSSKENTDSSTQLTQNINDSYMFDLVL